MMCTGRCAPPKGKGVSYDQPSTETWQRLFTAAGRLKELAPWEWMEETDLFGIQDPDSGEMGFVSIMGMAGEHYALALYRGAEGLQGFWSMHEQGPFMPPELFLNVPQLQVSFEDRDILEKRDRDLIKELGLKFRGRQQWPMFRSYRRGYAPWYLEADEARFLAVALEQAIDTAERYRENPALLDELEGDTYLIQVPQADNGQITWEAEIQTISPPEPQPIPVSMKVSQLEQLKQKDQVDLNLEVDLVWMPTIIQETRDSRPYYPYLLLMVDARQGYVLASEILPPFPTLEAMWGEIPGVVVEHLNRLGFFPRQVTVASHLVWELMDLLTDELPFELDSAPSLPALDAAAEAVTARFS